MPSHWIPPPSPAARIIYVDPEAGDDETGRSYPPEEADPSEPVFAFRTVEAARKPAEGE